MHDLAAHLAGRPQEHLAQALLHGIAELHMAHHALPDPATHLGPRRGQVLDHLVTRRLQCRHHRGGHRIGQIGTESHSHDTMVPEPTPRWEL